MNWKELMSVGVAAGTVLAAAGLLGAGEKSSQAAAVGAWRVAEPVSYESLSVFPIVAQQSGDTRGFITLDEALASGEAVVTEQGREILRRTRGAGTPPIFEGGGAQVNQLVLVNRSAKPLLLLAGELVSGGKQDRIIAKDRIVAPGADPLPLDVFCVEHGRWSTGSRFAAAKMMVHPSVREKAAVDQSQSEVWSAVAIGTTAAAPPAAAGSPEARLSTRVVQDLARTEAPTGSYAKIYDSHGVSQSVDAFADELERRFARATAETKGEQVVGVVVAYGGEVAWSDVFASPALFERYWPKLMRSYVVEALARPQSHEHATLEDAREFLRPLGGRENTESEPGVYRWREIVQGSYAELELEALRPKPLVLHWVKIHRTS